MTDSTPFKYAGEYHDQRTALYYLRARYYDPTTGQFTTGDPLVNITGAAYVYTEGNPVQYGDPTGLISYGKCLGGQTGFFGGLVGSVCLQVAIDDRTGDISVGGSMTGGVGIQYPATVSVSVSDQFTTARTVDQLNSEPGSDWYTGGSLGGPMSALGVEVSGGPSCGAPFDQVVGVSIQGKSLGTLPPMPAEIHSSFSGTSADTWFSFNPLSWLK